MTEVIIVVLVNSQKAYQKSIDISKAQNIDTFDEEPAEYIEDCVSRDYENIE